MAEIGLDVIVPTCTVRIVRGFAKPESTRPPSGRYLYIIPLSVFCVLQVTSALVSWLLAGITGLHLTHPPCCPPQSPSVVLELRLFLDRGLHASVSLSVRTVG